MFFSKKDKGSICGFDKKPCIKNACVHFIEMERTWKDEKGQYHTEKINECCFVSLVKQNCDIIGSNNSVQKSVESLRNETVKSHNNVLSTMNVARALHRGE